jgi:Na+-translocating ferredoxin:NAD+ oxidoreductase subunit D
MTDNKERNALPLVSSAPHIRSGESIRKIMWSVVAALAPAAGFSVYRFGVPALVLIGVSVGSALAAEALIRLFLRKPLAAVLDGSAVITGLLLAMNLPPRAPWWMAAVGSAFAIIIVKQLFGGLGFNIFNPALSARALLMASWPVYMTTAWHHFSAGNALAPASLNAAGLPPAVYDTLSRATPLGLLRDGPRILADSGLGTAPLYELATSPGMLKSLFIGNVGGCLGETSAALLLAGALFLLARRIITWHIPVAYLGTVAAATAGYYYTTGCPAWQLMPLFHIMTGGLVLGAFFMATDMVTSPVTRKGMLLFGAGCGLVTFIIRTWGGYPEGVSYAILIMNAFVPLIDRMTKPRVFGTKKGARP